MKFTLLVKTSLVGRSYIPKNTISKVVVIGNGNTFTTEIPVDSKLSLRDASWMLFVKAAEFLKEVGVQSEDEVLFTSDNAIYLKNFVTTNSIPDYNKEGMQRVYDVINEIGCKVVFDIHFREYKHLLEETPLEKKVVVKDEPVKDLKDDNTLIGYTHTGTTAGGVFYRYITEEPVKGINQKKIEYQIVKQW